MLLTRRLNVLIGAPSSAECRSAERALSDSPLLLAAERVHDPKALRERAGRGSFDALIVDAEQIGLEPDELERLRPCLDDASVIVVARQMPLEKAVAYMRAGARDVLPADRMDRLPAVLERELADSERQRDAQRSQRVRAERAIARGERRFRNLADHAADGFFVFDSDGRLLDANDRAARTLGYSRDELLALRVRDVDTALGEEEFADFCSRAKRGGDARVETVYRRKDGTTFPVEVQAGLLEGDGDSLFLALARDISQRTRAEEQIAYLAHYDPVTDLPNRELLEEHVELALARAQRTGTSVALLFIDLDNFQLVKESLGHAAGDELLRQAAARLREVAGTMQLVGRHGSDEFLLVLPDLPADGDDEAATAVAASVAARVHEALEQPFSIREAESFVGASIGISLFPSDARDAGALVDNAAVAMQQARRHGVRPWRVFAGESLKRRERLTFGTKLRKAVERREFVLHYQPIVDLASALERFRSDGARLRNHIVGVEALIRWCDPERGMVPPGEFIPLAEEMGLIQPIADWVAAEVCRQSREWLDQDWRLNVSFNISLRELREPELVERLLADAARAGVPHERLVVEVTESTAMTDSEQTLAILGDLRAHGFRLAIDDFGSGHSSLARLGEMPADTLKIDRAFISGLPDDETAATMVTAIIQLADNLGMEAVAEGIETTAQLEFLVERNCRLGQGFLFSRPVPPAAVAAL